MILVSSVAAAPTRLDPLQLFLDADIVVQVVIGGLVLASIWVWTIVVSFSLRMGRVHRGSYAFEEEFWAADHPETLVSGKRTPDNPSARVAAAGLAELRHASVRLRQRALRGGNLLAEAAVRVGFISPEGRPRRQPASWRAAFDTLFSVKDPA